MAKRHDQYPAGCRHVGKTAHRYKALSIVEVLPNGGQEHAIEARFPALEIAEIRQPIVQPLNPLRFVKRHTCPPEAVDRLDRNHIMSLVRQPSGIAAGAGADVHDSRWRRGQKIADRSIELS